VDIQTLGLTVERQQVVAADAALDSLAESAEKAEASSTSLARTYRDDVSSAFKTTRDAAAALEQAVRRADPFQRSIMAQPRAMAQQAQDMANMVARADPFQRTIMQSQRATQALQQYNTTARQSATVTAALSSNTELSSRTFARGAFAVQSLTASLDGGRVSAQGMSNTLIAMGGRLGIVGAALAVGATAYNLFARAAQDTARRQEEVESDIVASFQRIRGQSERWLRDNLASTRAMLTALKRQAEELQPQIVRVGPRGGVVSDPRRDERLANADDQRRMASAIAVAEAALTRANVAAAANKRMTDAHRDAIDGFVQNLRNAATAQRNFHTEWQEGANKNVEATRRMIAAERELKAAIDAKALAQDKANDRLAEATRKNTEFIGSHPKTQTTTLAGFAGAAGGFFGGGGGIGGIFQMAMSLGVVSQAAGFAAPLLSGLARAIFGTSDAARRAAEIERERTRRIYELNIASIRATISGDDLAGQIIQVQQQFIQLREQLAATLGLGAVLKRGGFGELDELERQRIEQLRAADVARRMADAMQKATDRIESLTRTIEDLRTFRDSLSLNTQLTTLSPIEQLREARRQYNEVLGAAQGGDQAAAGRFPAVAQAFLQASRAVNASSMAYVQDFNRVRADTDAIAQMFADQRSIQEQMLEELRRIAGNTSGWNPSNSPTGPGHNPQDPNNPFGPGGEPPPTFDPQTLQFIAAVGQEGHTATVAELRAVQDLLRRLLQAIDGSPLMN